VIYDPLTGQPFPNNVIPAIRIEPIARNIIDMLYPEPNIPGRVSASGPFGNNWLNEFRFGWSSVKFNMTSIDYGENLAERVGIRGVNLNEVTRRCRPRIRPDPVDVRCHAARGQAGLKSPAATGCSSGSVQNPGVMSN